MPLIGSDTNFGSKTSVLVGLGGSPSKRFGGGKRTSSKYGFKKRKRASGGEIDIEPDGLSSGLSSKRNCKTDRDGMNGSKGFPVKDRLICNELADSNDFNVAVTHDEERRRKERQMRFSSTRSSDPQDATEDAVFSALSVPREKRSKQGVKRGGTKKRLEEREEGGNGFVGTCRALEKPYLRLTTFPKPEEVRPLSVLTQTFEHIKTKYRETEDFPWANEQFKSLRQDLTVQGLRNDFVLEVYEVHARLALEEGDLNEFNQCQTMIKSLTLGMSKANPEVEGIELKATKKGTNRLLKQSEDAVDEFAAYRLLYAAVQNEWGEVNKELMPPSAISSREKVQHGEGKECDSRVSSYKHAVLVAKALIKCDYHAFFVLYDNAPNMSGYLMDFLVQRVRASAFRRIIAAYRPTLSVEFFRETLFFHDLEETRTFLKKNGAIFVKESGSFGPPFWVDCKASKG